MENANLNVQSKDGERHSFHPQGWAPGQEVLIPVAAMVTRSTDPRRSKIDFREPEVLRWAPRVVWLSHRIQHFSSR